MSKQSIEPFADVTATPLMATGEKDPGFTGVQDFLQRFGYLEPQMFNDGQIDDATATALAQYQARHGLAASGAFDEQTKQQMTTHRCGMPDLAVGVAFSTRCSWPNPTLTFASRTGPTTSAAAPSSRRSATRSPPGRWPHR